MQERVFGTENEMGIMLCAPSGDRTEDARMLDTLLNQLLIQASNRVGFLIASTSIPAGRLWLPNGGCVYIDLCKPEYSTPECMRVKDLVAHNKAGERILSSVWGRSNAYDTDKLILVKNNVARAKDLRTLQYVSYGFHANYLTYGLNPNEPDVFKPIFPFFVTQQIFDGAGWWKDAKNDIFHLSQRAQFIGSASSGMSTAPSSSSYRPLILTRNEPFMGECSGMYRVQFVFSDANMLEFALYLKFGITAIMLSMLERRILPKIRMEEPLRALHELSASADPNAKILRIGLGENINTFETSAVEIQIRYWEAAKLFLRDTHFESEALEEESRYTLKLWGDVLGALANKDWSWLTYRVDWVTKRAFTESTIANNKTESPEDIRTAIDVFYHEIGPFGMKQLNAIPTGKRILEEADIERAVMEPPKDTRARIRGTLVLHSMNNVEPILSAINWDRVKFDGGEGKEYLTQDPFVSTMSWFESTIANQ